MPNQVCRVCKARANQSGFLYRCKDSSCGAVHWDKRKVKNQLRNNPESLTAILEEANVPAPLKVKKSKYVYILRLKGGLNSLYVGKTGLHPYERYLNHIRGYKSSKYTKRNATALVRFEGPMIEDDAIKRERELAMELREENYTVCGGH